jgi:hypothetical protein
MGAPERPMGRNVKPVHITNGPLDPVAVIVSPGTTVTSKPDAVVGVGATVLLSAPPPKTLAETVQNTGTTVGTVIRVREAGGTAGAGIKLLQNGVAYYKAAVAALEIEEVAGIATSASIQFEIT